MSAWRSNPPEGTHAELSSWRKQARPTDLVSRHTIEDFANTYPPQIDYWFMAAPNERKHQASQRPARFYFYSPTIPTFFNTLQIDPSVKLPSAEAHPAG
jgi:hypothetical protein